MTELSGRKRILIACSSRFRAIPECEKQTDRQNYHANTAQCMLEDLKLVVTWQRVGRQNAAVVAHAAGPVDV